MVSVLFLLCAIRYLRLGDRNLARQDLLDFDLFADRDLCDGSSYSIHLRYLLQSRASLFLDFSVAFKDDLFESIGTAVLSILYI